MRHSVADYHTLIAKAVGSLDESNDQARRAVYERARAAQMKELRAVHPPLSEWAIAKERLTLESAIAKVETDALREAGAKSRKTGPNPRDPPRPSTARLEQDTKAIASEETAVSRSTALPWSEWLIAKWARGFSAIAESKAAKSNQAKRPTKPQICPPAGGDNSG
jgi:hypothetical protein